MEKENMKKLLMALLGIALVISMAGVVSAGDMIYDATSNPNPTDTTTVKLYLSQEYTITIPDEISLDYGVSVTNSLSVSNLVMPANKVLIISAESENDWSVKSLESGSTATLTYDMDVTRTSHNPVKCDSSKSGAIDIYRAYMDQTNDPATLTFTLTGDVVEMGNYEDTITFSVSVRDRA